MRNVYLIILLFAFFVLPYPGDAQEETIHEKKRSIREILTEDEISKLIAPRKWISEICIDRQRTRVAICAQESVNGPDNTTSEIIIVDGKTKRVIYNSVEARCINVANFSPDGQYLAYFSHPPRWSLERNFGEIAANQVAVVDLKNSKKAILAKDCPGFVQFRLLWTGDSKHLVFLCNEKNRDKWTKCITSWTAETGKTKKLELKGAMAICEDLIMLVDDRIVYRTARELFLIDHQFKSIQSICRGNGINSIKVEGNKIKYYDQEGKVGKGVPREAVIPPLK